MTKMCTKKILLILMLIIMAFCFCACGSINAMIVYNEDDTIDEVVIITLKQDEIINAGYELSDIKANVYYTAQLEISEFVKALNNKVLTDLETAKLSEVEKLNSYYNGITAINEGWQGSELRVGIKFKNIETYKYFYNIPEEVSNEPEIEEHFFYDKVIYKGNTLYLRHAQLYKKLKSEFETEYPNLINHQQSEVCYTYITDLRREHSDADQISYIDGQYYHTWKLNPEDTNKEITLYYNITNKANCIFLVIGISFGVLIILGVVALIINKKNKSKII